MTPNARTKIHYEKQGYMTAVVEHWLPFPKPFGKRHDLFGIFDLIAIRDGKTLGIQATTQAHVSDRISKMKASTALNEWIQHGGIAIVVGWAKKGPRGKRKLWEASVTRLDEGNHGQTELVVSPPCPI